METTADATTSDVSPSLSLASTARATVAFVEPIRPPILSRTTFNPLERVPSSSRGTTAKRAPLRLPSPSWKAKVFASAMRYATPRMIIATL